MKNRILAGIVIIAGAVIVISFFMPWANIVTSVTGVSKELTTFARSKVGDVPHARKIIGDLEKVTDAISGFGDIKLKTTVSGYKIPTLVNSKTSKVALSVVQIMFRDAKGLGLKSYLVYLFPLLGITCAVLAILGLKQKLFIILMAVISGAISIAGLYNLKTADLTSLAVRIHIESGLMFTMYAFLLIFLVGITWLILGRKA